MSDEPESSPDPTEASADDHPESSEHPETDDNPGTASAGAGGSPAAETETRLGEYLLKGALVLLALLALVATLQFYFATQTAISRWVAHEYRPLFLAAFNLVVLLASGVGITLVLRRLTG